MSNDPSDNQILAFPRAADGSRSLSGTFTATGGKGTGAGLGNQHGLVFDAAQNLFFAVKALVVTEKGTNMLGVYTMSADLPTGPLTKVSSSQTPFGFDFSANSQVIVSEAWGGMAGLASTNSYSLDATGVLTAVSGAVPSTRTSACWLVVAGDYAYVANAMTNDITGYKVAADGKLSLLSANGVTAQAGKAPVDEDTTDDNDFLYVVNNGDHSFSIFQINADGSLTKQPDFVGLPSTASGVVAR